MKAVEREVDIEFVRVHMDRFVPVSASKRLGLYNDDIAKCARIAPFYGGEIASASMSRQLLVGIPPGVTLELLVQHERDLFDPGWYLHLLDNNLAWLREEARPGYHMMQIPGFSGVYTQPRTYDRPYVVEMVYAIWAWNQMHNLSIGHQLLWCKDRVDGTHDNHYFVDPKGFTVGWGSDLEAHSKVSPALSEFRQFPFTLVP